MFLLPNFVISVELKQGPLYFLGSCIFLLQAQYLINSALSTDQVRVVCTFGGLITASECSRGM